jgi:NAD+ synthase
VDTLAAHLTDWIKTEIEASGGAGAVFGLSGGVDSAVVAALALRAFPHQALGLIMPCHSDPQDAEDAQLVAHHFGLATATVDLEPVFDALLDQLGLTCSDLPESKLAGANIKPRLRMTTLYAFANQRNYRVLGTGNSSELAVGYFTKYGDGGVDLLPLGNVTKTRVRELAHALDVPQRIIDKPPSAGLWAGQTDEGEMGVTYAALDAYLEGVNDTARAIVDPMRAASAHKRALPRIAPPVGG